MAVRAGLVKLSNLARHVESHAGAKGINRLRRAVRLADPRSESPMETLPWRNFRLVRTKRLDVRSNPRIVRTIRGCRLAVQPRPAFHAETVPAQIVMSARGAHQPSRRIGLQPALVLAPVPDAVLRSEHPSPAFAIEHRQVAHGDAIRARLEISGAPLLAQDLVSDLCFREWINRHAGENAARESVESIRLKGPHHPPPPLPKLSSTWRPPAFLP